MILLPYLVITELGHVDTLVVVATHPLQLAVTLQTRPSVQQSHPAVTAAVADLHLKYEIINGNFWCLPKTFLTEIVVGDPVISTDRVPLHPVTLQTAVRLSCGPELLIAGALIQPGVLCCGGGWVQLQLHAVAAVSLIVNLDVGVLQAALQLEEAGVVVGLPIGAADWHEDLKY